MIDFNFYPEGHLEELVPLLNEGVPKDWTIARFIEEAYNAKLLLWAALNEVNEDGNVVPKWKGRRARSLGHGGANAELRGRQQSLFHRLASSSSLSSGVA
jgi:hypothetical protein